jgi:hypothetical protein
MQQEGFDQFQQFIKEAHGDVRVLEQCVSAEVQNAYFQCSEQLRKSAPKTLEESDYQELSEELNDPDTHLRRKQLILSTLALSKETRAYRILEQYASQSDNSLIDWAYLALMESRIILETDLSGERQVYIATGLGGKGSMLRFFVLLLSNGNVAFEPYQRKIIRRECNYFFTRAGCEIESINIGRTYAKILVLTPLERDALRILESIIVECNQYGNFISSNIILTNVKEPTEEEIREIVEQNGVTEAGD